MRLACPLAIIARRGGSQAEKTLLNPYRKNAQVVCYGYIRAVRMQMHFSAAHCCSPRDRYVSPHRAIDVLLLIERLRMIAAVTIT